MGIPVEELQDRITAREYQSWKHYKMVVGPFGIERADYNTASIVKAIHELGNIIIATQTSNAPSEHPALEDFLLRFKRISEETPEKNHTGNLEVNNIKALRELLKTMFP
ncbi:MAG: hypothetical protein LBF88_10760, partial [Planctomycetaceae bacterium]|nr:hypothetical protein [Planctomycetaceae bacterium]